MFCINNNIVAFLRDIPTILRNPLHYFLSYYGFLNQRANVKKF